jgi:hypothetical protein
MDHFEGVSRFTAVITNVSDMQDKLWYNIQAYEWALSVRDAGTHQGFAIIDYAQSSCAMHAWVCKDLKGKGKDVCIPMLDAVPWSGALRAIANNAKHASSSEKEWPGGSHRVNFLADPGAQAALDEDLANLDLRFGNFLQSIEDGHVWGEGQLIDPEHPDGVPAQKRYSKIIPGGVGCSRSAASYRRPKGQVGCPADRLTQSLKGKENPRRSGGRRLAFHRSERA